MTDEDHSINQFNSSLIINYLNLLKLIFFEKGSEYKQLRNTQNEMKINKKCDDDFLWLIT